MGRLIVFEGIDGSGKSTLARRLFEHLRDRGEDVVLTREPSDGPLGQEIRRIAREGRQGVSAREECDLFLADRAQDVAERIQPTLDRGGTVVVDRYYLSNAAYQGSLGLDPEEILAENEARFPTPDIVFLIDVTVEVALERIRTSRPGGMEPGYEREEFLQAARSRYLAIRRPYVLRVAGDRPPDQVFADILGGLTPFPQGGTIRGSD